MLENDYSSKAFPKGSYFFREGIARKLSMAEYRICNSDGAVLETWYATSLKELERGLIKAFGEERGFDIYQVEIKFVESFTT